MRENNRKPIEIHRKKLPQFTTMNVIEGQAGLVKYSSLIFYSLILDNILNIIVLLILAGVTIATLTGENGILTRASEAAQKTGEVNAEEQVQIAVAGSIGKDGNIDNDDLRDNLNQIDGIEGVPNQITDDSYPLTVTIDGYEVTIKKDGSLKQAGKWAETTNNEGETVITDGTIELKIGDYVEYDPTNEGQIKDTEQINNIGYSYKSEQGTRHNNQSEAVADTRENMTKGNGYGDQYFSVESETNGWRVLGLDENTDEILLISADTVGPVSGGEEYNGQTYFILRGQTGYEYGIQELNAICEIYGKGNGASGARSINVDDINKITGYNPDTEKFNDGRLNEYGNRVTYTKTSSWIQYQDTLNNINNGIPFSMFRYYVNGKWKTLADGESSEPIGCNYYEYEGLTYLKDTGSQKYEMLFARTSDEQFYWLASQTIDTYTSVSYDLYCVDYGMIHSATYGEMASSRGSLSDQALGVRPVVSLESDINISGGIGTSEDPFQIK